MAVVDFCGRSAGFVLPDVTDNRAKISALSLVRAWREKSINFLQVGTINAEYRQMFVDPYELQLPVWILGRRGTQSLETGMILSQFVTGVKV